MTANLISHHRPRRKRGSPLKWIGRRLGALIVVLLGIAAAAWLAPYVQPGDVRFPDNQARSPGGVVSPNLPEAVEIEATAPAPAPAPRPRRRSGVPLDAQATPFGEDFEVLSASELDAISQARD